MTTLPVIHNCGARRFKRALIAAAECVTANKSQLNKLNVFPVPDGDTGTNMSLTLQAAVKEMENVKDLSLETLAKSSAWGALLGARGNSGVILAQVFAGIAEGVGEKNQLQSRDVARAFDLAAKKAYKAVIKPTEGTILTVLRDTAATAAKTAETEANIVVLLKAMVASAHASVQNTPHLLPKLKEAGVVDAGGLGFAYFVEGMLNLILGLTPAALDLDDELVQIPGSIGENHNWHYRYCTEFILKGSNISEDSMKLKLAPLGDSLVVVGDSRLARVHIHTSSPEDVLKYAGSLGRVSSIKVDDMLQQHTTQFKTASLKPVSVVAVTLGDGLKEVFLNMGAELVIEGGNTMNPSVADILSAIDTVASANVIVLPNNSNVHLAVEQAARISKKKVQVLATKTVPEGLAAMISYRDDIPWEDNVRNMGESFSAVVSGELTVASRAASLNGYTIQEGDFIGVKGSTVIAAGTVEGETLARLLTAVVGPSHEIITLFYGEHVPQKEAEEVRASVENAFPGKHIEMHYGGQPYTRYLISAE
ncbi:MAG: hypothetical protein A2293_12275 [Elusimicrobia bacterium RIFOXYB2_FULL_49_7]|nr:MAG: hypothetical protein A2293_12275 [Elusimicrobia bacterium RIFOXYB2_FULL_49_7]